MTSSKALAARTNFSYVPALSEDAAGLRRFPGFVHEAAKAHFNGDFSGRKAYLCGPPPMIEACLAALMQGVGSTSATSTPRSSSPRPTRAAAQPTLQARLTAMLFDTRPRSTSRSPCRPASPSLSGRRQRPPGHAAARPQGIPVGAASTAAAGKRSASATAAVTKLGPISRAHVTVEEEAAACRVSPACAPP